MPTFKIDVCNLIAQGGRIVRDGEKQWSESLLNLDGYQFKFRFVGPYQEFEKRDYQGRCVCAANAFVDADNPQAFMSLIDDACWLLSLGHCSAVAAPRCWGDNAEFPVWARVTNAAYDHFRPVISSLNGDDLMGLVEKTWPKYQQLKVSRMLPVAIDYFVKSQALGRTRELGLVIVFVLLEHLKYSFVVSKGFQRAGIDWRDPVLGRTYRFKALLNLMFSEVSMTPASPDMDDVVKLRNQVIHTGLSEWDDIRQRATFDICQNLCREYLLRLLGFTGDYHRYEGGAAVATIP